MIRIVDTTERRLAALPEDKKKILTNALNTIYTTAITLVKIDVIRSTIGALGMAPTDYDDKICVTLPQMFAKILYIHDSDTV